MVSKIGFIGVAFLCVILLLSGCATNKSAQTPAIADDSALVANEKMAKEDAAEKTAMAEKEATAGKDAIAKDNSFYKPFSKSEYDAAIASQKIIFLEFYANWCPSCAAQKPINEGAFASAQIPKNVAGFQVNYKDSDTDADEVVLAKQFGITYQHTRVVLKVDGSVSGKSTGNIGEEQILAMLTAAGA